MITFKTDRLLKGVDTLAKAVGVTLGPKGQNVAIDKNFEHIVLHDGVSVAKAVHSKNKFEELGIKIVREAAQKQVQSVGDGTTVTIVLANEIIKSATKMMAAGVNPMGLRKEIESGAEKLIKKITEVSKPIKSEKEAVKVATVSAEDAELGELVGRTIYKRGVDSAVTVEESKGADTYVDIQDGMRFDKGYLSSYFITDPETQEATVEDAKILITDYPITDIHTLAPLLKELNTPPINFVIIAPEVSGNALASFILTKQSGNANILCVGAPLFGDKQKQMLQDIAILTGGRFISKDIDSNLNTITLQDLGRANRITANAYATTIVGGLGESDLINNRIETIKTQLKNTDSEFEKAKLSERLAKLTSGVAVIKVGGHTEIEMKERKERVDDAIHATIAAMEDGIVPGGEIIYEEVSSCLGNTYGEKILKEAISKPFDLLMEHAGYNSGQMRTALKTGFGIDVFDGQCKDMMRAGIIDPAKVSKEAIKNSVSVAIQIITTGACIIDHEKMPSLQH